MLPFGHARLRSRSASLLLGALRQSLALAHLARPFRGAPAPSRGETGSAGARSGASVARSSDGMLIAAVQLDPAPPRSPLPQGEE